NYVFRWNKLMFEQVVKSYILQLPCYIKPIRLWNHNLVMDKVGKIFGGGQRGRVVVQCCYYLLDLCFGWLGNMMIGLLIKNFPLENYKQ
ncbi:MAG: hypothetical protein O4805_23130, partial [Trichodesmium sp. St16_bin2-tuft]|nr:hypothetical protein [Trichodesmium sp. St16_bin2-tuft]